MKGKLGSVVLEDAVVYPTMRHDDHPKVMLMGVRTRDGDFPPDGLLQRRSTEPGAPMPEAFFPDEPDYVAGTHLYAGVFYNHFGHFLLESLAKLWAAPDHPDATIVWIGNHRWARFALRPWQTDILDVLGLRNPSLCLTKPMRFERLVLPQSGYHYDDAFHPDHARFLAQFEGPAPDPEKKLWLTRAAFSDYRDRNAAHLDRRLAEAGWTVEAPERLPLKEQLALIASAGRVAGEEGSALHLPMLLKSHAGRRYDIFKRTRTVHGNFITIGERLGLDQHFHDLPSQRIISHAGRAIRKVSSNTSEALDILGVPTLGAPPAETPSLIARIATWIAGRRRIERCLDAAPGDAPPVWLTREGDGHEGRTLESGAHERGSRAGGALDVVRGRFAFDPRAAAGARFFEVDPEVFFSRFLDGVRYDLFLMDGRDHDRALRAFAASVAAARRKAIWLFSDEDGGDENVTPDPPPHQALAFRMQELFPSITVKTITIGRTPLIAAINLPMPEYAAVFFGNDPKADFASIARLTYESTLQAWLRNNGWLDQTRRPLKFLPFTIRMRA